MGTLGTAASVVRGPRTLIAPQCEAFVTDAALVQVLEEADKFCVARASRFERLNEEGLALQAVFSLVRIARSAHTANAQTIST